MMEHTGDAIRWFRTSKRMTQTDVATRAGISVSHLSLIELGKRDPRFSVMQNIANALGVALTLIVFMGESHEGKCQLGVNECADLEMAAFGAALAGENVTK